MNFATMFTGIGGFDYGAIMAGATHRYGFEIDARLAEVGNANGLSTQASDVLSVDPTRLDWVDYLHASPPCQNFSIGGNRAEVKGDLILAKQVSRFIGGISPDCFSLENVPAYRNSKSFALIIHTLELLGYMIDVQIVDMADYGLPQHRHRLIIRAKASGLIRPWMKQRQRGWHGEINDLLPECQPVNFAKWQMDRLPKLAEPFMISNRKHEWGDGLSYPHEPSFAMTASDCAKIIRVWDGRQARKLSLRAMARLQGFPDSFILPANQSISGTGIGNAVPPIFAKQIIESLS